jgi:hypothetical protein
LGKEYPHPSGGCVYIFYMTTTATVDELVLGEGEAMHYIKLADLNPPQPYQGHPFTTFAAQAIQGYLATLSNH